MFASEGSGERWQAFACDDFSFPWFEFSNRLTEVQGKEGLATRACCVVILDKGKPVERPGRKARERTDRAVGASPAAEGMLLEQNDAAIASGPPSRGARKTRRSLLERFGASASSKQAPAVRRRASAGRVEPTTGSDSHWASDNQ